MKKYVLYLFAIISTIGCIDQVDFSAETFEQKVVVDGVFTDLLEKQTIKLSYSQATSSQVRRPLSGAVVKVESDAGDIIDFVEEEPGNYVSEARAERGKKYRLVGTVAGLGRIESNFQGVPDALPIKEIMVEDSMRIFVNESGQRQRQNSLDFYATAGNASIPNALFLRFSVQTAYQIRERVCSPFVTPKTCYFYNDRRPVNINILKVGASTEPVSFTSLVHQREIDHTVAELFALDLSLYSYNEEEYDYWDKVKKIFDQSGNISDTAPARLKGNILAEEKEVLGQFAVVAKTREIKLVGNADFSTYVYALCTNTVVFSKPRECCSCLGFEGATTIRPTYWP